jgi:hypothetical protein
MKRGEATPLSFCPIEKKFKKNSKKICSYKNYLYICYMIKQNDMKSPKVISVQKGQVNLEQLNKSVISSLEDYFKGFYKPSFIQHHNKHGVNYWEVVLQLDSRLQYKDMSEGDYEYFVNHCRAFGDSHDAAYKKALMMMFDVEYVSQQAKESWELMVAELHEGVQ